MVAGFSKQGSHMNQSRSRKLLRALFTAGVVGVGGLCLAQAAEQQEVWVKRAELEIREGKGAIFPPVATARKGNMLTVLAREGSWLKVRFGDKQGYVLEASTSLQKIGGGQGLGALAGGPQTSGQSTALAAKGLEDKAEDYAKLKGMNPKLVDEMIRRNESVTGEQWLAFQADGNVGVDRKK